MGALYPSRRVLGLPAWFWVVLPIPLLVLGNMLWKVWVPSKLSEPAERREVFRELVLVTRDGDSFRFVQANEPDIGKPLWSVNVVLHDTATVHWQTHYILPGLFHRESRWTYDLDAHRFDANWKGDNENPFIMPAEQVRQLRPLVVAELNRRNPAAKTGDRLESLLTDGREASSYVCPQNAVVVLSWLSLPMALAGLCSMFIRPRAQRVGLTEEK
jgi:hypothetical protein